MPPTINRFLHEIIQLIEFPEDTATAVGYLKATLPLLMQYKLSPTPINYGVCYLYASQRSNELQRALDALLAKPGGYTEAQGISLFRQFLLEEYHGEHRRASGRLHLLTQEVQGALHDTLQSANTMDKQLTNARASIGAARQMSDLEQTVEQLLSSIDQLASSNRDYRRIAQSADSELDRMKTEVDRLQRATDIDDLTQLYSRAALWRELDRQITTAAEQPFSIIMMDIDHFKSFNDRFGHLTGDRVLQRIGSVLLQQLRANTMAARFGGEEFIVVCRDTDLHNAALLAERLRDHIQRLRIKIRNSDTVLDSITASFGVAMYRPNDSVDSLLERADRAMYQAKHNGRNTTQLECGDAAPP